MEAGLSPVTHRAESNVGDYVKSCGVVKTNVPCTFQTKNQTKTKEPRLQSELETLSEVSSNALMSHVVLTQNHNMHDPKKEFTLIP